MNCALKWKCFDMQWMERQGNYENRLRLVGIATSQHFNQIPIKILK